MARDIFVFGQNISVGKTLIFVSETEARELVSLDEACDAIERMFLALHHDSAVAFPVVTFRKTSAPEAASALICDSMVGSEGS